MLKMPASFLGARPLGSAEVHETLAGVEYRRTSTANGDLLTVETDERSVVPEVPFKDATAAKARLKALAEEDAALPLTSQYRVTPKDLAAKKSETPASAQQYIDRGLIFLNSRDFDSAVADFTRVIELEPKNAFGFANRAIAYAWKNKNDAAEKDLVAAEALDPTNAVAARARGLISERNNDYQSAISAYSVALAKDPDSSFALGHRALAREAAEDHEGALADSEQALRRDPRWMDLRVLRANIFYRRGDRDAVAKEAQLVMEQNSTSDYAFVVAGKIYARLNRRLEAMQAFDKALAIKPQAYVFINRAQSRPLTDESGRNADFEAALKLTPNDPDALAGEADILARHGRYSEAADLYARALQGAPDDFSLKIVRGAMLYKTGQVTEAQRLFADVRAKAHTSSELNTVCWSKAKSGVMLDSALEDCRKALELKPDSLPARDSFAFVLMRLGKIDEAIAEYTAVLAKSPLSASYMGRSIAYAKKGQLALANADREQALRLDSDVETAFADYGMSR
jgi:tetratricopeptide (TPR) repeat protein